MRTGSTTAYLGGDDLDGGHEAVGDDGHAQEHVHQAQEVDGGPGELLAQRGVQGKPNGEDDSRLTVCVSSTLGAVNVGGVADGDHCGGGG